MIIPKVLAQNSGLDPQESIVKLQVGFAIILLCTCFNVFTIEVGRVFVICRKSILAVASLLAWTYHQVNLCYLEMKVFGTTIGSRRPFYTLGK